MNGGIKYRDYVLVRLPFASALDANDGLRHTHVLHVLYCTVVRGQRETTHSLIVLETNRSCSRFMTYCENKRKGGYNITSIERNWSGVKVLC